MKKIIVQTLVLLGLSVTFAAKVHAQGTTFSYQGRVADTNGPLNSTVAMEFRIYETPAAGAALWAETHSSIAVTNGLFSAVLGQSTPVDGSLFDGGPRWLGISINGG